MKAQRKSPTRLEQTVDFTTTVDGDSEVQIENMIEPDTPDVQECLLKPVYPKDCALPPGWSWINLSLYVSVVIELCYVNVSSVVILTFIYLYRVLVISRQNWSVYNSLSVIKSSSKLKDYKYQKMVQ